MPTEFPFSKGNRDRLDRITSEVNLNPIRLLIIWLTLFTLSICGSTIDSSLQIWSTSDCPCYCYRDDQGQKTIHCTNKTYHEIPNHFDPDVEVFILNGKKEKRNQLLMSLMFQHKLQLKHLQLTYNRIKRIGSKAFGNSKQLQIIDMRNNEIASLAVDEFIDLENLRELYLGHNRLTELVSGIFKHLIRLSKLDLSFNRLKDIHSSNFLYMRMLMYLDLSGNPFKALHPSTFKSLTNLQRLHLTNCNLKQLHSLAFDGLVSLTELNLSFNLFEKVRPHEFKVLKSLRKLNLTSNQITLIEPNAFSGHSNLQVILSSNLLIQIDSCAFCNSSIESLDLSSNRLRKINSSDFGPLFKILKQLDLSFNYDLNEYFLSSALSQFKTLSVCNLSHMALDDRFRFRTAFSGSSKTLSVIDLSFNHLTNLSGNSFPPLGQLERLDLSRNRIESIDLNATAELARLSSLSQSFNWLRLSGDGFSCRSCDLYYFWSWLRTKPNSLSHNCLSDDPRDCLTCRTPNYMRNQRLDSLTEQMLASCDSTVANIKSASAGSRIALVVGLLSISLIVILLVLVFVRKHYRGAIYYTNESPKKVTDISSNPKPPSASSSSSAEVTIATINGSGKFSHSDRGDCSFPSGFIDAGPESLIRSSRSSSRISKAVIDDIMHQVERDWRFVDDSAYNEFTANRLRDLENQHLIEELQMPNDSLTMPSSMTVLETYVRCNDIDSANEGPFSSYELPDDFEQTSAKTYEISSKPFLV